MKPNEYWSSLVPERKKALAAKLKKSVAYLSNIFNGHSRAGGPLSKKIHAATKGKINKADLRPDIF